MDFVLLKPIDAQFWLSVRRFSIWGLPNLLFGVGLMAYAVMHLEPRPAWWGVALLVPTLACAITILYAMGYILSTITIWFVKIENITHTMQALLEAGRYPIAAYPPAYRVFFTAVVPVAFMTTVPAEAVMGRAGWTTLALTFAIAVGMLMISRLFWRFALRFYTSASS